MTEKQPLAGRVVAVPETRHVDVLAGLLEKRGASVVRCPLVAIRDVADEKPVIAWIERLIAAPPDVLILYTGEGVERLLRFARRGGVEAGFVDALARTTTLTRGPKPKRALRAVGAAPTLEASEPTTDGIIATLDTLQLDGGRAGVQLYGTERNARLMDYLASRRVEPDCVAPYTYATEADDERVVELITRLRDGRIDAIAFTSKSQVQRLRKVAAQRGLDSELQRGLAATRIAAVGPVVAAELSAGGVEPDAMPPDSFHMKPLVNALAALFGEAPSPSADRPPRADTRP